MRTAAPNSSSPDEAALSFQTWKKELFDPANRFDVSLVGTAGRLKLRPDWAINGMLLPNHLFYYVVEGTFEAQINGVSRMLNVGDMLWAGPGVPLWFRMAQRELVVLRFRLDAFRHNGQKIAAPQALSAFSPASGSQFLIERLVDAASAPATTRDEDAIRAYLLALCFELERATLPPPPSGILTPAQCDAVRRCLTNAPGHWPSPADLAAAAELSPPYFTRLFTRTFHRSPRRFLLEERMRLASVRLLESSASVSQIARDLGYADVFAFSRQFKAVQGQNPSTYRAISNYKTGVSLPVSTSN